MRKVTLVLTAFALAAPALTAADGDWVTRKLDTKGNKGIYCTMTFDNSSRPLVAYMEAISNDSNLLLARFDGTQWRFGKVDTYGDTGYFIDIATDGAGHPHISYVRFISVPEEAELRYARYDGTKWHVTVVDKAGVTSVRRTSIAIDSKNHPHISYTDWTDYSIGRLKYAYHDGTRWHISEIEPVGTAAFDSSIAVDAKNRPHIAYVDIHRTEPALKYAYYNGSRWEKSIVEEGTGPKRETSIAIDSKGRPRICYLQDLDDDLIYAVFDGSKWRIATIDHEARVDYQTRLALDRDDRPHISYTDSTERYLYSLKYAYSDGSKWYKEDVEKGNDLGTFNAIAIDKKGRPHIVYYEGAEVWDLKYAHRRCGIGVTVGEFKAFPYREAVALRWKVDEAVAGFNLYRDVKAANVATESVKINPELITGKTPYLYLDDDVESGETYRYWLEVVELTGPAERHGPAECTMTSHPRTFALSQNVPNPARATTTIAFAVPAAGSVEISLYDVSGRKVKTVAANAAAGENELDVDVAALAPGIYTYRLEAGGAVAARRMVIIR